jgi:uncharacterized membrane protein
MTFVFTQVNRLLDQGEMAYLFKLNVSLLVIFFSLLSIICNPLIINYNMDLPKKKKKTQRKRKKKKKKGNYF